MIVGAHAILFSKEAAEVRAVLRDVLGFGSVDAGDGWLIFALPPAELGVHPTDGDPSVELYLLCDAIEPTIAELEAKGIACDPVVDRSWGRLTFLALPGGTKLGLYEPKHATTIDLPA